MFIQKAGMLKVLRYLGIFCAITMGFMTIVATSEDDAKDAVEDLVDVDYEEDVEMELEPVAVEKESGAESQSLSRSMADVMAAGDECGQTSVNDALETAINAADIDVDIDVEDIGEVELDYVEADYTAVWSGDNPPTTLTCTLNIAGVDAGDPAAQLSETTINGASGTVSIAGASLTVVDHYLQNPDKEFMYCAACTDTEGIETYTVTFNIEIGVTIRGEI